MSVSLHRFDCSSCILIQRFFIIPMAAFWHSKLFSEAELPRKSIGMRLLLQHKQGEIQLRVEMLNFNAVHGARCRSSTPAEELRWRQHPFVPDVSGGSIFRRTGRFNALHSSAALNVGISPFLFRSKCSIPWNLHATSMSLRKKSEKGHEGVLEPTSR